MPDRLLTDEERDWLRNLLPNQLQDTVPNFIEGKLSKTRLETAREIFKALEHELNMGHSDSYYALKSRYTEGK